MRRTQTSLLLLILGGVLVIGGIIYGSRSHYLGYKASGPDKLIHTVLDPSSDMSNSSSKAIFYIQLKGDPNIYYMNTADFVNWDDLLSLSPTSYMISYDDATSAPIHITGKDTSNEGEENYTISGTAYRLVQLVANSGNQSVAINTRQYVQNPQGRYENDWPIGTGAIILGAILLIVGLFLRRGLQAVGSPSYMVMQPGQVPPYPGAPMPYAPQAQSPYAAYPPAQPSHPSYPGYPSITPMPQAQLSHPSYPGYPPVAPTPQAQLSHPSYPGYPPVAPTPQVQPSHPSYPGYMPTESAPLAQPASPSYPPAQPAPSEHYGSGQYTPQPPNPFADPAQTPNASYPFAQPAPFEQYGSEQYTPQQEAQPHPISPEAGTAYGGYQLPPNADPDATQIGKRKEE
ncbi:hypothetical protein [Ktedonospora formicarum]|uniref:Uncharacterized protein n=1 Tax=Ktedonospora formicarum TaxID=2778364 RepID=A0A8J3I0A8_9CHLR|nr:hypothetical protein [Ktedonospora formicarum]GHO45256.1 hypothetical protein KSX_34190 [Ktedonospora formicarum]